MNFIFWKYQRHDITFASACKAGKFFKKLIKKGRGIGPMKPWQPLQATHLQEGANSSFR